MGFGFEENVDCFLRRDSRIVDHGLFHSPW